jgi:hypothetical protein
VIQNLPDYKENKGENGMNAIERIKKAMAQRTTGLTEEERKDLIAVESLYAAVKQMKGKVLMSSPVNNALREIERKERPPLRAVLTLEIDYLNQTEVEIMLVLNELVDHVVEGKALITGPGEVEAFEYSIDISPRQE